MAGTRLPSAVAALLLLASAAFAQAAESGAEEPRPTGRADSPRERTAAANALVQPFEWEGGGDVLYYEIVIERSAGAGKWSEVWRHETTEEETESRLVLIDPLLPPGEYRSTVYVYNVLGQLEGDGVRDEFRVLRAHGPEVGSLSYPLNFGSTVYLDDLDNDGVVLAKGRELLLPPAEGASASRGDEFTRYELRSALRTLLPLEVVSHGEDNESIAFRFDMRRLDVGEYSLYAEDASGLHSDGGGRLSVRFKKLVDLDVTVGGACPVVLHNDVIPFYMEGRAFPLGGMLRVSLYPIKHSWGHLGVGVRGAYSRMSLSRDVYDLTGNLVTAHAMLMYQMPLMRRRLMVDFHAGAGVTWFCDVKFLFPHGIESRPLDTVSLSAIAGVAAQYYLNKRLYIELGLDYTLTLNKDMTMGAMNPSLGAGWQF